jgi:hypothetical protein
MDAVLDSAAQGAVSGADDLGGWAFSHIDHLAAGVMTEDRRLTTGDYVGTGTSSDA